MQICTSQQVDFDAGLSQLWQRVRYAGWLLAPQDTSRLFPGQVCPSQELPSRGQWHSKTRQQPLYGLETLVFI